MACEKAPAINNAEAVQDGEEEVASSRGRGKLLENGERNTILQALLSHTKNQNSNMLLMVLFQSSSMSLGSWSPTSREEERVWQMELELCW
jgi:hypothetical protein